jgi:predicted alpha/beta-hydrolase family hydrolase
MKQLKRKIRVDATRSITSIWSIPERSGSSGFNALVLAHGAGNDMHHPFMRYMRRAFARAGILTVTFNFPYKETGGKMPDRAPLLEQTYRAVLARLRADPEYAPDKLVIGGKSMGGRMASHLAAAGEKVDGLLFLGYPLHPANKPDKLRVAHLAVVNCPMLFIQGARDSLCSLELLRQALKPLKAKTRVYTVEGGDHSYKLPRRMGRSEREVWEEIVRVGVEWLRSLGIRPD